MYFGPEQSGFASNNNSSSARMNRFLDVWNAAGCAVGFGLLGLAASETISPELRGTVGDIAEKSIESGSVIAGVVAGALLGITARRS